MTPFDIEVLADREDDLEALFALLHSEDEGGGELPPIIVDTPPRNDYEGEAA